MAGMIKVFTNVHIGVRNQMTRGSGTVNKV